MPSLLIIVPVEKLQARIISTIKSFKNLPGVYVSLNKTQKSTEKFLKEAGINTSNLFFIDGVALREIRDGVLHIAPTELDLLRTALVAFMKDIKGEEFIIIDGLSTLLIYNTENKVAKFVKQVTECASQNESAVVAFSPKTKEKQLLNKIFNFFDKVEKKAK